MSQTPPIARTAPTLTAPTRIAPARAALARTAYISAGSNLGDRAATLRAALRALDATPAVRVAAVSPLYETDPVGGIPQPLYLNLAARLEVAPALAPETLLAEMHRIERAHGRRRETEPRHGPRTLDLDLLLFGDETRATPFLTLPHPRMWERPFVLIPLREVAAPALLEKLSHFPASSPNVRLLTAVARASSP